MQGAGAAGAVRHPRPLDPSGGESAPLRLLALQEPRYKDRSKEVSG